MGRIALCGLFAVLAVGVPPTLRAVRAARVLAQLMEPDPAAAGQPDASIEVRPLSLPLSDNAVPIRARLYAPPTRSPTAPAAGLVLLHGAHPRGIDEPRLVSFARSLAQAGVTVLTPELPELIAYRINAHTVERIAELAGAHARACRVRAVGVMGISFAGGLALLAAANARHAGAIAFVVAVGAHHDLFRLSEYYAGRAVRGPSGERARVTPHPYGARVLLREHLDRFFSPQDLPLARAALDTYLQDRHAQARAQAKHLSPAGRDTLRVLLDNHRDPELGRMLLEASTAARAELAQASPRGQLAQLAVPAFLVHGQDDPIIPSLETLWLARELPAHVPRRVVVTPLLRHAERGKPPTLRETWELIDFMAAILRAADAETFRPPRTSRAR